MSTGILNKDANKQTEMLKEGGYYYLYWGQKKLMITNEPRHVNWPRTP